MAKSYEDEIDSQYSEYSGVTPTQLAGTQTQQTYDWYDPTAAYGRVSNGNGGYTNEYTWSRSARDLQGRLNEIARQRGDKEIAVDGYYGKETADAVKRYLGGGTTLPTAATGDQGSAAIAGAATGKTTDNTGSGWKRPEDKATTGRGLVGNPTAAELKDKVKIGEVEFTPEDKRVGFGDWLFGKRTVDESSPNPTQYAVEEEYRQQAARDSDNGTIPFEMLAKQELDENGETGYYRYLMSQVENQKPPEYLDEYVKPRSAAPATTGGTGGKKSELDSMPLGEVETKPFKLGDFGRWLITGNKAPAPTGGTGGKQSELDTMPYSSSKPSEEYRSTVGNGNTDADYERRRIDGTRYMSEAQLAEIVKDSDPGFYRYLQGFIADQSAGDRAALEEMANASAVQDMDSRAFGAGTSAGNFAGVTNEQLGRSNGDPFFAAYADPEFYRLVGGGLKDLGSAIGNRIGEAISSQPDTDYYGRPRDWQKYIVDQDRYNQVGRPGGTYGGVTPQEPAPVSDAELGITPESRAAANAAMGFDLSNYDTSPIPETTYTPPLPSTFSYYGAATGAVPQTKPITANGGTYDLEGPLGERLQQDLGNAPAHPYMIQLIAQDEYSKNGNSLYYRYLESLLNG